MTHKYTIEMIFHFTCSQCKNWWSIALMHHKEMNVYADPDQPLPDWTDDFLKRLDINE